MTKHKSYNAELKLQVVLEVLKGQKSLAEICREHEVAADLVCHWRDVFLERAPQVFTDPRATGKGAAEEQRIADSCPISTSNAWATLSSDFEL
jgi:transposase